MMFFSSLGTTTLAVSFLGTATTHAFTVPSASMTATAPRYTGRFGNELCMSSAEAVEGEEFRLDPQETAFVFIEYQNEFTTEGGKLHDAVKDVMEKTNMLENSSSLLSVARNSGSTIVHAPINFEPGHDEIAGTAYGILAGVKEGSCFTRGEWGADFSAKMMPQKGDLAVKGKSGLCSFASTNLDFLLRQKGAKNVVLGGFLTNCCVESTMRTAYELGYKVYTLSDCMAATSMEAQEATMEHNFGMFSIPKTSKEVIDAMK
mmetsp:Transcript_19825/g.43012  ORF Transcript_19825/g.43012 Transcript_19825/m.43012 type:complete len:261 (+) Transcript_19825:109-891(+)|eukprot:CAMPEP_0168308792 /NCGR_PEP_ID=MMETSP0142_2-20121227/64797_1 /TAXON_ID=44445 /ORGANISM="Pseudo-nitzschia australis, Strain 10249 10 AB" /LENGTH=260 /DNA_ID=CAMNT_0008261399 /DNA_START=48 /DNA_END=830 /DNA_ORIENTATION=+